jgi:hypothetical protein
LLYDAGNPFGYDDPFSFKEGLAAVKKGGKYGYIDSKGAFVVEPRYEKARPFHDGLAWVRNDNKWTCLERGSLTVREKHYDDVCDFSEGLAAVKIDGMWGYINKDGTIVIKPAFSMVNSFSDELAWVSDCADNKNYFINNTGNKIFQWAGGRTDFREGLASAWIGFGKEIKEVRFLGLRGRKVEWNPGYNGYINKKGELEIEPEFLPLSAGFSEGLACVEDLRARSLSHRVLRSIFKTKTAGLFGYIGQDGKYKIQPCFENASSFLDGLAAVRMDEKWGVIDKNGDWVVKQETFLS